MTLRAPVDFSPTTMKDWGRKVATTLNQLAARKLRLKPTTVAATYAVEDDFDVFKADTTSAAFTMTLPKASPQAGRLLYVKRIDGSANNLTVDGNGSETIDGAATIILTTQWESRGLFSDGSNWITL